MTNALARPLWLDLNLYSRLTGVHPELIRRLVRLGLLEVTRDARGDLWFDPSQVAAMGRIQRLRSGLGLNYASLGLVLDLLDRIIDGSPQSMHESVYFPGDDLFTPLARRAGIPIGNLTSQFFANLYLDDLDHHIKQVLRVRPYLRYVDDMVVLDQDKTRLADIRAAVRERLAVDRLRLHPHKAQVTRTADGLNLLGYVLFPDRRRLRNDNGHRFARKLRTMARAYRAGRFEWAKVAASVQSWIGHAKHADTEGLRRAIFSRASFIRGSGQATAIV